MWTLIDATLRNAGSDGHKPQNFVLKTSSSLSCRTNRPKNNSSLLCTGHTGEKFPWNLFLFFGFYFSRLFIVVLVIEELLLAKSLGHSVRRRGPETIGKENF
jgi:hypothetical protein